MDMQPRKHSMSAVNHLKGMGLGVVAGGLALFYGGCSKPAPVAEASAPMPVTVAPVVEQDVPRYLNSIGYATAFNAVSVLAQVDGQILSVNFQQGSPVKKGDLLFQIDPRPYQAVLDQANGQLANDQAALGVAQLQVQRSQTLAATNLVAQQTFDTYVAQVQELQAKIQSDQGAILAAQVNLEYCTIHSPVDGIAGFYNVNQGNEVFSANQTVLTTIMQVTPIYLDFTVTGAQLPDVQERFNAAGGNLTMKASYLARADPWRAATLKYLGNAVDQTTGTVMARGVYDNTDRHFWPGQAIRTQLILETLQNALLVPTASLSLGQAGYYVYVMGADSTVAQREVTPGEHEGNDTIITSGVQAGEQVVVTGQYMLKAGDKVRVVTPLTGEVGEPAVTETTAPDAANITPAEGNATTTSGAP
jgi:multidrug efflux system membrane fusion protein